jgi:hypothetical protein
VVNCGQPLVKCGRRLENGGSGWSGRAEDDKFPARWRECVMLKGFPESFIPKLFEELCQKRRGGGNSSVAFSFAKIACLICLFFWAEDARKYLFMIPSRPFWIWAKVWNYSVIKKAIRLFE